MSPREAIRDAAAAAHLEVCKQFGVVVSYSHEGSDYVNLYAMPSAEIVSWVASDDVDTDVKRGNLQIARQVGFPPSTEIVTTVDDFQYKGLKWVIADSGYKIDSLGAIYVIDIIYQRATNINGA